MLFSQHSWWLRASLLHFLQLLHSTCSFCLFLPSLSSLSPILFCLLSSLSLVLICFLLLLRLSSLSMFVLFFLLSLPSLLSSPVCTYFTIPSLFLLFVLLSPLSRSPFYIALACFSPSPVLLLLLLLLPLPPSPCLLRSRDRSLSLSLSLDGLPKDRSECLQWTGIIPDFRPIGLGLGFANQQLLRGLCRFAIRCLPVGFQSLGATLIASVFLHNVDTCSTLFQRHVSNRAF